MFFLIIYIRRIRVICPGIINALYLLLIEYNILIIPAHDDNPVKPPAYQTIHIWLVDDNRTQTVPVLVGRMAIVVINIKRFEHFKKSINLDAVRNPLYVALLAALHKEITVTGLVNPLDYIRQPELAEYFIAPALVIEY